MAMRRRDGSPIRIVHSERLVRDGSGAEIIEGVLIELPRPARRPRAGAEPRLRILVVDDEPELVRAVQRMLVPHEVVTASSVADALVAIAPTPPSTPSSAT
jgi:PleD family two-component response regulator